jgi:type IV pilus assembly protein PilA
MRAHLQQKMQHMVQNQSVQSGFTLIELMIVVAIVGILAAIGVPAYQDYTSRAQVTDAISLIAGYKTVVAEVVSQDGTCPANGTNGVVAAASIKSRVVNNVALSGTGTSCTILATMNGSNVNSGLTSKTITFTVDASSTAGSLQWKCTSSILQKLVPKSCVGA